jgi:hypothetical protein
MKPLRLAAGVGPLWLTGDGAGDVFSSVMSCLSAWPLPRATDSVSDRYRRRSARRAVRKKKAPGAEASPVLSGGERSQFDGPRGHQVYPSDNAVPAAIAAGVLYAAQLEDIGTFLTIF